MTDTPSRSGPSIAEVAALTARLRALSQAGRNVDPAEADRFLTYKRDLIDRITAAAAEAAHEAATRRSWHQQTEAVRRAVEARDAAIDNGDVAAATHLDTEARNAIDAALAAGATREMLAVELDYPGGADELDGPHIDAVLDQHSRDGHGLDGDADRGLAGEPDSDPTDSSDADGRQLPSLPDDWRLWPEMLDGIEERRTGTAQVDNPAELQARIEDLRQRIAEQAIQASRDAARRNVANGDPGADRDPAPDQRAEPPGAVHQHVIPGVPDTGLAVIPPSADAIAEKIARARGALAARAEEDRLPQLNRWHTNDATDEALTDVDDAQLVRDDEPTP